MLDLRIASRRFSAAVALALLATAPAFAATYNIGLFQGTTGTGSGSFTYTNPENAVRSDPVTVSNLSTNASSSIGVQSFNSGTLNVQVSQVNFSDNKTSAKYGPNQITGFFVEGLTGSLSTTPVTGLRPTGQCQNQTCFYRITFFFTANTNPNLALKNYMIELVRQSNGNIVETPVPSSVGRYSVSNTSTIPEPGSVALLAIGFAAMAWTAFTRRRRIAKV